jgi:hypothetical protein
MLDIVPSFQNVVSVAASQKTQCWHSKNGKHIFCGMKQKMASVVFLVIARATRLSDIGLFWQAMP